MTNAASDETATTDADEAHEFMDVDLEPGLRAVAPALLGALGVVSLVLAAVAAFVIVLDSALSDERSAAGTGAAAVVALSLLIGGVLTWAVLGAVARMVALAERADIQRLAILNELRRLPD